MLIARPPVNQVTEAELTEMIKEIERMLPWEPDAVRAWFETVPYSIQGDLVLRLESRWRCPMREVYKQVRGW